MEKAQLDKQLSVINNPANNKLAIKQLDIDINIKIINLAKNLQAPFSCLSLIDGNLSDKTQNNKSC